MRLVLTRSLPLIALVIAIPATAQIVAHAGAVDKPVSSTYGVTVGGSIGGGGVPTGGTSVPVRTETTGDAAALDFDTVMFDIGSSQLVKITLPTGSTGVTLKPRRNPITLSRSGDTVWFTLAQPRKLVLEVTGRRPLAILARPFEAAAPTCGGTVTCYPANQVSSPNPTVIRPPSGQTIYIPSGAVVRGCIELSNKSNIIIRGRGILDVSGCALRGTPTSTNSVYGIYAFKTNGVTVDGITVLNRAKWWTSLYNQSSGITIREYATFSNKVTTDGIDFDGASNVDVSNSFVRSGDDGFGIHGYDAGRFGERFSNNVNVNNVVIWNTGYGNAIRFGTSLESQILRNYSFTNIDVLRYDESALRSDNADWAWLQNIRFRDIDISGASPGDKGPIRFEVLYSDNYSNPNDPDKVFIFNKRGNIEDISFDNVTAEATVLPVLGGYDNSHKIRSAWFRNVRMGTRAIDDAGDVTISTGFVENLHFNEALTSGVADAAGIVEAEYTTSYTGGASDPTGTTRRPQFIFRYDLLSNAKGHRMVASTNGDYADYRVSVGTAGTYTMTIGVLKSSAGGPYSVLVNGTTRGSIDLYAASGAAATLSISTPLDRGENIIKFVSTGVGTGGSRELDVDYFRLR